MRSLGQKKIEDRSRRSNLETPDRTIENCLVLQVVPVCVDPTKSKKTSVN
jgi:hypothetical protein